MRILIALDQHPDTLGGAQQSALLQRTALAAAGHEVLFLAPGPHPGPSAPVTVDIPGVRLPGQEYRAMLPTRRAAATVARRIDAAGGVDLVHVQADYWGAVHALAYARARDLPVVITFHNNVAAGMRAVLGGAAGPALPVLMGVASAVLRRVARVRSRRPAADAWHYLGRLADAAHACTTGTAHFARALRAHGVASDVAVVSNGIDDAALAALPAPQRPAGRPVVAWAGRLSAEKRPLEFLEAVALTPATFDVRLYGDGPLRDRVAEAARAPALAGRVSVQGRVPYPRMLAGLRDADLLAQTSVGFETQGMTVFEALTLGTPVLACDPQIAAEFDGAGVRPVADPTPAGLAAALSAAAADAAAGRMRARLERDYRQSVQTAAMLEQYALARTRHAAGIRAGAGR